MLWLLSVSLRRNFGKYILALLALSATVAVSSLGMSGVALMLRLSRKPISQLIGGDLMVLSKGVSLASPTRTDLTFTGRLRLIEPEDLSRAVKEVLPGSETSTTLLTLAHSPRAAGRYLPQLAGRYDPTGSPLYSPPPLEGISTYTFDSAAPVVLVPKRYEGISWGPVGNDLDLVVGRIPDELLSETISLDVAGGTRARMSVVGVYDPDFTAGWLFAPLPTVQALGQAGQRVTWAGITVADLTRESTALEKVRALLERDFPELQVIDVQTVGELLISDFRRLKETATFYFPVSVLISSFIISVTCLSLIVSRRRELGLMRAIGLSKQQIAGLFVAETCVVSLIGGVAGYLLSLGMVSMFFRLAGSVTVLPALSTVLMAGLVSGLMVRSRAFSEMTDVLRNP